MPSRGTPGVERKVLPESKDTFSSRVSCDSSASVAIVSVNEEGTEGSVGSRQLPNAKWSRGAVWG